MCFENNVNIIRHFYSIGVHLSSGRCAVTKRRWCSFERATTLPSSWVNLGRNNCILVRDRWCHLAVRNLVFHNFAIWCATCIETLQDRGDDCYMAEKGEDNLRNIRENRKLGFPSEPAIPCDPLAHRWNCRWLGHVVLSAIRIALYIQIMRQICKSKRSSIALSFPRFSSLCCNLLNF